MKVLWFTCELLLKDEPMKFQSTITEMCAVLFVGDDSHCSSAIRILIFYVQVQGIDLSYCTVTLHITQPLSVVSFQEDNYTKKFYTP
jgi:hypothetical protein